MMDDKAKMFLKHISAKLALLLGGAIAVQNSSAMVQPSNIEPGIPKTTETAITNNSYKLPAKLILKKTNSGLQMIAQHSSHSSHASHASHSSHSSHSSHASRAV
jgi:hypothetical protein